MATQADIESYLMRAGLDYEEVEEGTLVIRGEAEHTADVVMRVDDPIVVYRMKVMALPEEGLEDFLRKLLMINARDMLHASSGLEDDTVVLGGAQQLENLDYNEVQAMLDDIYLAISNQFDTLKEAANRTRNDRATSMCCWFSVTRKGSTRLFRCPRAAA